VSSGPVHANHARAGITRDRIGFQTGAARIGNDKDLLARPQAGCIEQVTIVGISHYHFDHTGQAASFPHARLIMGAGDVAALRGTDPGVEREPLAPWLTGGGTVAEANGDHDVFGDNKVILLNLPGHTPGHRGLLVRLASGPVLLSGDTYHFADQVAHHGVPPFNTSRAESLASMDRFDRLGRNLHANVIIQHEPADVAKLPAFPASAR